MSVVICCNSKNSALYLNPIEYYRPDKVFIFINDNRGDIDYDSEARTFEKEQDRIDCRNISIEECDTHNFEILVSRISDIIRELKREYQESLDIFINITSGTHEFAAAGILSAMSNSDIAAAFRVDILKRDSGRCTVSEPIKVTSLNTSVPDPELIAFLDILNEKLSIRKTVCFKEIIRELKDCGQWTYDPQRKTNSGRDTLEHKEITYLTRHYVRYAVECGWITRPSKYRLQLTSAGKSVLNVHSLKECSVPCCVCGEALPNSNLIPEQEKEVFDILDEDMNDIVPYRINGRNCIIRYE